MACALFASRHLKGFLAPYPSITIYGFVAVFRTGACNVELRGHERHLLHDRGAQHHRIFISGIWQSQDHGLLTQVGHTSDAPSTECVHRLASAQIERTTTATENTKSGATSATLNVNCAANLLLKSVSRFKERRPPAVTPAGSEPRPAHTLCGLTWQVTLPDVKQLRLSEDAVLHMRRILDEFSYACNGDISRGSTRQRLYQLLFEFFDTFGSHVFRRPAWLQLIPQQGQLATPYPLVEGRGLLYTQCRQKGGDAKDGCVATLTAEFAKT